MLFKQKKAAFLKQPVVIVNRKKLSVLKRLLWLGVYLLSLSLTFFIANDVELTWLAEKQKMKQTISSLNTVLDEKNEEITALKSSNLVHEKAREYARQEMIVLQTEIAQYKEQVTYYLRIMDPPKGEMGLRLDKAEIYSTTDDKRFRYKILLAQYGEKGRSYIEGVLKITLIGNQDGKKTQLPLSSLSKGKAYKPPAFRFKYFRQLEGEFVLNKGFMPEQIKIEAIINNKKRMNLSKVIAWEITEL